MIISLIAAVDEKFGIGLNNKLPWGRIKDDMTFFKETTLGSTVIMGRKTFESIGSKPLVGRKNIVLSSSNIQSSDDNLIYMKSLENAITSELFNLSSEIFIIGGAKVYADSIKYADRLYLTHIPDTFNCDTFFPYVDDRVFKKKSIKVIEYKDKTADIYLYYKGMYI